MNPTSEATDTLRIRYVGGPTALVEMGGVRLLTDPTFDSPGTYPVGTRFLTKTVGPAIGVEEIGPIDAVLLSHDQHPDNLDTLGRAYLQSVPLVLSTVSARNRLGGAVRALPVWEHLDLTRPDGKTLRITALPAQHGPDGSEHLVGEVIGFLLSGTGLPVVYVSGDNASLNVVRDIAHRFGPVDVALLFAGGAQTPLVGDAYLTLPSEAVVEATRILAARRVVPLHFEHWAHFTQGRASLQEAFARTDLSDRLHLPEPGEWIVA